MAIAITYTATVTLNVVHLSLVQWCCLSVESYTILLDDHVATCMKL